jgi:transcriptional regulator with PAS, ATPase and Fis domain
MLAWVESFSGAVTVADTKWKILYMNEKASQVFAKRGGREALVGGDLMACHPDGARAKLRELLESGRTNAYTITKDGVDKLIYQAPWYSEGKTAGIVELSIEMPRELPHFDRS